jgi:hypothetical protein
MTSPTLIDATSHTALEAAAEKAGNWLVTAKPVIRAMIALFDMDANELSGCDPRTFDAAWPHIEKAATRLHQQIEDIREEAICDHSVSGTSEMTEAEWDAVEEFNDALRRDVVSVAMAIRIVRSEA